MNEIRTSRLRGRPVEGGDAGFVTRLFGAPEVGRWTCADRVPWPAEEARARTAEFAAHWQAHGFGLRVWEERGAPVALAGLQLCVLAGRGAVEASFAVSRAAWGRGLGREALAGALTEAPEIAAEVMALAHLDNLRARRVLAALGFSPVSDGAAPDHALFRRRSAA